MAGVASYGIARWTSAAITEPATSGAHARLEPAAPNPFRASTEIAFALPRAARTRIALFDLAGRRVRDVLDAPLRAGAHHVAWDGRDARGFAVPPGVYLARLDVAGEPARVRHIVRLR